MTLNGVMSMWLSRLIVARCSSEGHLSTLTGRGSQWLIQRAAVAGGWPCRLDATVFGAISPT